MEVEVVEGKSLRGDERGQGWISALKMTGLGCLLTALLISICLLIPKTATAVRGGGGGVEEMEVEVDEGKSLKGGERGQGWISALKMTGLGCLLTPLLISICLLIPKTASSVRGGGGGVEAEMEVERPKGTRARSPPRERRLGVEEVRTVVRGCRSDVGDLGTVTKVG